MTKVLAFFLVIVLLSCNRSNKIGYTVPVVNPTNTYDNRSVGLSANDLLSSKTFKAINIEFCYVTLHRLPDSVMNAAIDFLSKYCYKPGGIHIYERDIPRQGGGLIIDNLITIEKLYRTQFEKSGVDGADTLGIFVLVTESDFSEKEVLGLAYKNTAIALFDGAISDNSGGSAQPSKGTVTISVLQHEIGHLLGLVNAGTGLQSSHQDVAHGKHCNVPGCLMNYQVQTTEISSVVTGNIVPVLDAKCEDDLRANGGK